MNQFFYFSSRPGTCFFLSPGVAFTVRNFTVSECNPCEMDLILNLGDPMLTSLTLTSSVNNHQSSIWSLLSYIYSSALYLKWSFIYTCVRIHWYSDSNTGVGHTDSKSAKRLSPLTQKGFFCAPGGIRTHSMTIVSSDGVALVVGRASDSLNIPWPEVRSTSGAQEKEFFRVKNFVLTHCRCAQPPCVA